MKIKTLVVGSLEENCYVVYDPISREAIITDPGDEPEKIIDFIRAENLKPLEIINTHGHWDHIGAVNAIKEAFGIPFYMHEADAEWLTPPLYNLFGNHAEKPPVVDRFIKNGDEFRLGTRPLRIIHTPGHTRGGCVIWYMNDDIALTGDTLFKGTVGRTDFPGGSYEEILESVQIRLAALPDDCVVYPGHGPKSTMEFERAHNPYLRYEA
ncbi:MAG: MBL fold metallo-hydrolase [Peptococcaceae bacterium]|nr:MBL fold metallo-hydrolase [Peptococcaceae bacterium]